MSDLKPCPFCGGEARADYEENDIRCFGDEGCCLYQKDLHNDATKEAWNRRTPSLAVRRLVEAGYALADETIVLDEFRYLPEVQEFIDALVAVREELRE